MLCQGLILPGSELEASGGSLQRSGKQRSKVQLIFIGFFERGALHLIYIVVKNIIFVLLLIGSL